VGVSVRSLFSGDELKASRLEVVVTIRRFPWRPLFQSLLEVTEKKVLVLIDDDRRGRMPGADVDDAVSDGGAADALAHELGDIDELDAFLSPELHSIVASLELGRRALLAESG
jgi:hypothetical protein